jgi:hypothetical protein
MIPAQHPAQARSSNQALPARSSNRAPQASCPGTSRPCRQPPRARSSAPCTAT